MKNKLWKIAIVFVLVGCASKDRYGVKEKDFENIVYCETTIYEEEYSSTILEQLYANDGVIEYVYNEQFKVFNNKDVLENTKSEKTSPIDGITIEVNVDKKNGAISTITRIDYRILDYAAYLQSLTDEILDEETIEENKKTVTDLGRVNMNYCRIVK